MILVLNVQMFEKFVEEFGNNQRQVFVNFPVIFEVVGEIEIYDIVPRALGIKTHPDRFSIIVPEGSTIPGQWDDIFYTVEDNQTSAQIEVREEIRKDGVGTHQHLLDLYKISGIKPAPAHTQSIKVTYTIDRTGILHVNSVILATGQSYKLVIQPHQYQHTPEEIQRMKADHDRYVHAEDEMKRRANALYQIDEMLVKKTNEKKGTPSESAVRYYCQEVRDWIESNRKAPLSLIDAKTREVKQHLNSMK